MRYIILLASWVLLGSPGHTTETQTLPTISLYAPSQCQPCADWAAQLAAAGYMLDWQEKEPPALRKIERWGRACTAVGLATAATNVTWTVNSAGISINGSAYQTTTPRLDGVL